MPNYANSKIYTIRFNNSNDIYIGSTTQSLAVRFGKHKYDNTKISLSYFISNKYNGDWSNCYIELYENYSCNNREELHKKEGEIIRLFKNDNNYNLINKLIAGRTVKEWYQDNNNYNKNYYIDNNEVIKNKKKEYYNSNKDIILDKYKIYREENKDILKDKAKAKYNCSCGSCLRISDKARHEKTKKHQEYIKSTFS